MKVKENVNFEEIKVTNSNMTNAEMVFAFAEDLATKLEECTETAEDIKHNLQPFAHELAVTKYPNITDQDFTNAISVLCDVWEHSEYVVEWYKLTVKEENMQVLGLTEEEYDALTEEEIHARLYEVSKNHLCTILGLTEEELLQLSDDEVQKMYQERMQELQNMEQGELVPQPEMHKVDINKVKTLEDVITIIQALNIGVQEGTEEYELLKHLI